VFWVAHCAGRLVAPGSTVQQAGELEAPPVDRKTNGGGCRLREEEKGTQRGEYMDKEQEGCNRMLNNCVLEESVCAK
jgi:hypothetical protein